MSPPALTIQALTVPAITDWHDAAPHLDVVQPGELRSILMLATTQRTGSTMLGRGLAATGVAGAPAEYMSPYAQNASQPSFARWRARLGLPTPTLRGTAGMLKRRLFRDPEWFTCHRWRPESLFALLDAVIPLRTTPNGVFAVSVHANHHRWWSEHCDFDLARWGVPVHWVHLERVDKIAQAVSFVLALQTQQFTKDRPVLGVPVYDADEIAHRLAMVQTSSAYWDALFPARGIEPLRLTYEQLTADFEGAVSSVLTLLGEQVDEVPPPSIERQASALNREWIERFTADRPDLASGQGAA